MKTGDSDDICNSDDPLPEDWQVKVRVRPSGKKDKVTLEKSEPEGLPPEWTKEIKVTKKGNKIRRDLDTLRYIETGELGRLAFKPKNNSSNNLELEYDKTCAPAAAKKQKLEANRITSKIISDQSSKLFEVAKDKHALSPAGSGESMPVSEHKSGNCEVVTQSNSSGVQEDKDFNQEVGQNYPDKSVVATSGGALSNEHSLESETTKNESKGTALRKSKKKDLNLPCRASKRLAGLPLDPTPELKTTNRARRAAVKQSSDEESTDRDSSHAKLEAKHANDTSKNTKRSFESNTSAHPIGNLAASHEHVGKVETEKRCSEKPEYASVSSLENLVEKENNGNAKHGNAAVTENAGKIQIDNNDDEKLQLQLDLPLGELWQDPCIAFAIKTLTGISFDNTDSVQVSSGSNNSNFGALTTFEEDHCRKDAQNGSHRQQGCTVVETLSNLGTRGQHVGGLQFSNKDDGKPGSPLNLPLPDAWADPCIEFAIKTLTGAMTLDYDVVIQDFLQRKASSSQSQESSGLTLHNVGETGQSQIFWPQFGIQEQPFYNQGAFVEPGLRHSKNVNVGYSDGTFHLQHSEERS